ncbi:MAG: hypothetical protein L6408_00490 [Nanoarchaeota archaeon]|nr:hypothetical protein [Nanoarchaeota archaeon]
MMSRFVAVAKEEFPRQETAKSALKTFRSEPKVEDDLTLYSWIDLDHDVTFGKAKYISGRVFDQRIMLITNYELVGSKMEKREEKIKKTDYVQFWLSSDKNILLMHNSDHALRFGVKKISNAIFNNEYQIAPVTFNIMGIERKYKKTWIQGFRERQGNVRAGTVFGNDVLGDPICSETIDSKHNQTGIALDIDGEMTKVRVIRQGKIMIYKNWENPGDLEKVFKVVKTFLPFKIQTI